MLIITLIIIIIALAVLSFALWRAAFQMGEEIINLRADLSCAWNVHYDLEHEVGKHVKPNPNCYECKTGFKLI